MNKIIKSKLLSPNNSTSIQTTFYHSSQKKVSTKLIKNVANYCIKIVDCVECDVRDNNSLQVGKLICKLIQINKTNFSYQFRNFKIK